MKREAGRCFGELHRQIGPGFKALAISLSKSSLVDELQRLFDENPFDKARTKEFPKTSLAVLQNANAMKQNPSHGLVLDVPKTDIFSNLPDDIHTKLVRSQADSL